MGLALTPEHKIARKRYFFLKKAPHQFNFRQGTEVSRKKEFVLSEYAQCLEKGVECILFEVDGPTGKITNIS